MRCAGKALEKCDGTSWNEVAECLGSCAQGACSGGSCAPGLTLTAPASGPADGISTLLVTTGLILDAAGTPVPDGTPISVSAGAGAQIVAPGSVVHTLTGRADFAVRAPAAAATATLSATVAGSVACAAIAQITFSAPAGTAVASEDFTTDAERDSTATTAPWQTASGRAIATQSELGDGRDGAFTAPTGSWDLTTNVRPGGTAPYAPVLQVTAVGAQSVSVTGAYADAFQPGDEALLIELQGAGVSAVAAAGAWELLTVARSAGGQVTFTGPVLGVYGQQPGAALAGEKVVLQRVPHFTNLTVPAGAALNAGAWNGATGGVVALRVAGRAAVAGAIHADQLGYRGGDAPDSVHGQAGESYGGVAPVSAGNAGSNYGGGGGGYLCGDANHLSQLDTWYGSGGSHAGVGSSTCGAPGATYGAPSLSLLFFGSGSGSQDENTHQPCSDTTCPAESQAARPAASQQNGVSCGSDPHCNSGTLAYCRGWQGFAAAALPCDNTNNPSCSNTFAACGVYTQSWQDSPFPSASECATHCPRKAANQNSCYYCGCPKSNPRLCAMPNCNNVFSCDAAGNIPFCFSGDCGAAGTTGLLHGCGTPNNACAGESNCNADTIYGVSVADRWCGSNCILGLDCDCHYMCALCWDGPVAAGPGSSACAGPNGEACNTCNVCTGCQTNPGCGTNPGCHTCGPYPDGSICDYTTPGANCACPNPWQSHAAGGRGGGMVLLFASSLDLSARGRVSANGGPPAAGNMGGAGGSLFLRLGSLTLAASGVQISAAGAAGGGAGRIRLERAAGDDPMARGQISPTPYTEAFALPRAQSIALPLPAGKKAVGATLLLALDAGSPAGAPAPAESYFLSADGGATWLAIAPGASVSFPASADLRWRAQLSPQLGVPASVNGLSFAVQLQ